MVFTMPSHMLRVMQDESISPGEFQLRYPALIHDPKLDIRMMEAGDGFEITISCKISTFEILKCLTNSRAT